jgi:hypothetical protein
MGLLSFYLATFQAVSVDSWTAKQEKLLAHAQGHGQRIRDAVSSFFEKQLCLATVFLYRLGADSCRTKIFDRTQDNLIPSSVSSLCCKGLTNHHVYATPVFPLDNVNPE